MILIGNGRLITRDAEHSYYRNGAVLVEGNQIREVGDFQDLKENYPSAEFIDAKGMVIMPGLINAHHHIYSAFARGLALSGEPPKDFIEILEGMWWHIDRHLTPEQVYYSAMVTYLECIQNGVTCVFDHHASYGGVAGSLFKIGEAAQELQIRTCLAYEISDRDGREKRTDALKESMDFLRYAKKKDPTMLNALIGLHASFTLSDETLALCRQQNTDHAGYHIHVAEGQYDARHCMETYGKTIIERLRDQEILGRDSIAGHCIHISESDMEILRATKTTVVHNPQSNMGNGVGSPDVIGMLDKGILVGLGTDGYTNDMLESLKTANILQKHRRGMPDRGFSEACRLLFENNAAIASHCFGQETGVLRKGAAADIILVDYEPYSPMNQQNIDGHIMFGMTGRMTDTTIINGTVLMRGRKFLQVDEAEIKKKSREAAQKLWNSL